MYRDIEGAVSIYDQGAKAGVDIAGIYLYRKCVFRKRRNAVFPVADLVYEGKWFCPLREALQAFIESTQDRITGEVKFKLYKGNIIKAGTTSPYTLYSESLASFTTGDLYDHHDAEGFIHLFGLSMKVRAMLDQKREEKDKNNDK